MHNPLRNLFLSAAFVATALMPVTALAQSGAGAGFTLELNNAAETDASCRLTFVATNNAGLELTQAAYEVAVFDAEGVVDRLLILDFGAFAEGRTKVVQFDLADTACGGISRLLVNAVSDCSAADGSEPDCLALLEPTSRAAGIDFGL